MKIPCGYSGSFNDIRNLPSYVEVILKPSDIALECTLCRKELSFDFEDNQFHFNHKTHLKKVENFNVADKGVRGPRAIEMNEPAAGPPGARINISLKVRQWADDIIPKPKGTLYDGYTLEEWKEYEKTL